MSRERSKDNVNEYQRVGSFSQLVTSKFPKSAHVPTVSSLPFLVKDEIFSPDYYHFTNEEASHYKHRD